VTEKKPGAHALELLALLIRALDRSPLARSFVRSSQELAGVELRIRSVLAESLKRPPGDVSFCEDCGTYHAEKSTVDDSTAAPAPAERV
jgi:hypothetical protein